MEIWKSLTIWMLMQRTIKTITQFCKHWLVGPHSRRKQKQQQKHPTQANTYPSSLPLPFWMPLLPYPSFLFPSSPPLSYSFTAIHHTCPSCPLLFLNIYLFIFIPPYTFYSMYSIPHPLLFIMYSYIFSIHHPIYLLIISCTTPLPTPCHHLPLAGEGHCWCMAITSPV